MDEKPYFVAQRNLFYYSGICLSSLFPPGVVLFGLHSAFLLVYKNIHVITLKNIIFNDYIVFCSENAPGCT